MRSTHRRTALLSTAGATTALSLASPLLCLSPAVADTGSAEAQVEQQLWEQTSADPDVVSAYRKMMAAIATSDAQREAVARALAAVKAAKRTPGRSDDASAAAAARAAQSRLARALEQADRLKGAWDRTIETRLADLQGQMHLPTAGGATPAGAADGVYAGKVSHKNPFGDVQVTITVTGGKITDCSASYPTAQNSGPINKAAIPTLCSEALAAQSASIASVGGASYTSPAFKDSLADAIRKAGLPA